MTIDFWSSKTKSRLENLILKFVLWNVFISTFINIDSMFIIKTTWIKNFNSSKLFFFCKWMWHVVWTWNYNVNKSFSNLKKTNLNRIIWIFFDERNFSKHVHFIDVYNSNDRFVIKKMIKLLRVHNFFDQYFIMTMFIFEKIFVNH